MNRLYCWVCDLSQNTGEGKLANLFIEQKKIHNHIKYFSVKSIQVKNKIFLKILNFKYFSPFIGIVYCWFFFLKKKKAAYINYLPFWNIFIFILLPPKTIFGPITGGANFRKDKINIIRKYIFPVLYKISEFFIYLRLKKIIFSTDLLKVYLNNKTLIKSDFNYIFNIKKKNNNSIGIKNIDFLIYYRKHKNKESFFPYKFLKKIISLNFRVNIVGDYLNYPSVINHGYINNKLLNKLLSRTNYTIASNENLYSIFIMECINHSVKIIINSNEKNNIKFFKKNFINIDYNKIFQIGSLRLSMNNPISHN
jgi:hypothetical protein